MLSRTGKVLILLLAFAFAPAAWAQAGKKSAAPATAGQTPAGAAWVDSVKPLPDKPAPASSHAPFEAGDCKICHQSADARNPGPVTKKGKELCLDCHEEFTQILARPHVHYPATDDCTTCHSPHNAGNKKLLLNELSSTCTNACHSDIGEAASAAKVAHGALSIGQKCANCHNPHGSANAKLLLKLPMDLCTSCHNVDTMIGADGKKLQNIKAWLDANPVRHGPVEAKDCTACHMPHGSGNFRMLKEVYPKEFYAPYDARSYGLCFSCHQEKAFSTARTTTLTGFRDGDKNLHFFHLQQGGKGRTCRACHEVHAGTQQSMIRVGVPFGSSGWMLKLNYKRTQTGGSCEKTCHQERTYSNRPKP